VSLGATKQFFISRFDSNALRPSAPFMIFRGFGLSDEDFANHRLALRNERPLIAGQRSEQGQFHPLHRGLDAPQGIAAHGNLVRGEDQSEVLLISLGLEFSERELVKRQQ
jgi:hypothetical protein